MFNIRSVSLVLAAAILSGCATPPSLKDGYAAITVKKNNESDTDARYRSIAELDGKSTGTVFQPKTVYVKPGLHEVVEHTFQGPTRFIFKVEAGHIYVLNGGQPPSVITDENDRMEILKFLRQSSGDTYE